MTKMHYDIAVVGGGHAGVEAALASARLGKKTVLVTIEKNAIARMSCNPSIGGLAKGHLVRELDILGGEMGKAIDATGIQFKLLNTSKGRAVWSPRAQADKIKYEKYMQTVIDACPNLDVVEEDASGIIMDKGVLSGLSFRSGKSLNAHVVILTNGTFLRGLIHIGDCQIPAGRYGELPSIGLSDQLKDLGFHVERLKTGTPTRVTKRSIDFSKMTIQLGDENAAPFSHATKNFSPPNIPCWLTYTNERTHDILRSGLDRSPLYTGKISGVGPRYCPSIEDKIVRFADKNQHQLFLEPEWEGSSQWYVNGFSSSLPIDIQINALRTIPGLEHAEPVKIGYGIEYDYFPSHQIHPTLETKHISNLYFAGQINGTSGYEEAAVQGFMAAVNAVRKINGMDSIVFKRYESYIGVLIDDLCTKETKEPYRMFTSLAEYRLLLRWDNAHLRLYPFADKIGIQSHDLLEHVRLVDKETGDLEKAFRTIRIRSENDLGIDIDETSHLEKLILQHRINDTDLERIKDLYFPEKTLEALDQAYVLCRYRGYIDRQQKTVEKLKHLDNRKIPAEFDYDAIRSLSNEGREKLKKFQPATLGQASRIRGISPADIQVLMIFLSKNT